MEAITRKSIVNTQKEYYEVQAKWEDFTKFCNRIADELGETLYKVCDPFASEGRIYIHIPFENKNRIRAAVTNYSNTELTYRTINA